LFSSFSDPILLCCLTVGFVPLILLCLFGVRFWGGHSEEGWDRDRHGRQMGMGIGSDKHLLRIRRIHSTLLGWAYEQRVSFIMGFR
jgi:hypothetical protein